MSQINYRAEKVTENVGTRLKKKKEPNTKAEQSNLKSMKAISRLFSDKEKTEGRWISFAGSTSLYKQLLSAIKCIKLDVRSRLTDENSADCVGVHLTTFQRRNGQMRQTTQQQVSQ